MSELDLALNGIPVRDVLSDKTGYLIEYEWAQFAWADFSGYLAFGPYEEYGPEAAAGFYPDSFETHTGSIFTGWETPAEEDCAICARLRYWEYTEERYWEIWGCATESASATGWRLMVRDEGGGQKMYLELWYLENNYRISNGYGDTESVEIGPGGEIALVFRGGKVEGWYRPYPEAEWVLACEYSNNFRTVLMFSNLCGIGGSGIGNRYIDNFRVGSLAEGEEAGGPAVEFSFSPTGISVSTFSEIDEFTRLEPPTGTSVSTAEELDVFTWEELVSGSSSSTGEETMEFGAFVAMTLNGTSKSGRETRVNLIRNPTGLSGVGNWLNGGASVFEAVKFSDFGVPDITLPSGEKITHGFRIVGPSSHDIIFSEYGDQIASSILSSYMYSPTAGAAMTQYILSNTNPTVGLGLGGSTHSLSAAWTRFSDTASPSSEFQAVDWRNASGKEIEWFLAVPVWESGTSLDSVFPTPNQTASGEASEKENGTWAFNPVIESFQAEESISGSPTSSGSEVDTFERGELLSGESSSNGSEEQILTFEDFTSGASSSSFSETDEFSSTESLSGASASAGSSLDSAETIEQMAGSSSSSGSEEQEFQLLQPEQPVPSPIKSRRRLLAVRWKFFLCDSTTMELLGEIKQARGKNLQLALDKPGGCGFNVPIDYDLFKDVEEINHGIVAYRGDTPRYSGMIWNINENTDGNSIAIQSVGWFETLNHRRLRENVGYPPFSTGVVNAGQIIFMPAQGTVGATSYHPGGLLTIANAQRDTWIGEGVNKDVMQRIISYQKAQNIGQAISQLTEVEAGFDFTIDPLTRLMGLHNWDEVPDKTEEVVFGYNWGNKNIKSLGRQFDPSVMANRVTALGKYGGGFAEDIESQEKYQLFEEMPQLNDVVDPNVLLGYAGGEVLLRNRPRVMYSFQPFPYSGNKKVPQPFDDYDIGDKIFFTAIKPPRIDIRGQAVRVYGMNIDITDEGNEKVSALQISP
jgi:hypothetical protein